MSRELTAEEKLAVAGHPVTVSPGTSDPRDVLRKQSMLSWKMHEETGAPLINVPIPVGARNK